MSDDRRERYAAALYHQDYPNTDLWQYAESDAQGQYREYADAAIAVADAELDAQPVYAYDGPDMTQQLTSTLNEIADLRHQLDAANLNLTAANLKLQLAEENLAGMKVTQKSQHDALRSIRVVLDDDEKYDSFYCGELVITINEILKGLEL
jgi:hypothetical protein